MKYLSLYIFIGIALSTTALAAESISPDVTASGDTITAKHRYTMGDNDSKSDATTICFLEAKRKAIEYAGVYVESTVKLTQTESSQNTSSDIKTMAASLVSAEMVSSKQGFDNGRSYVDCVVNAKVDKSKLKENITKITSDPIMKKQVEEQQNQLKKLEIEVMRLQHQLQTAPRQEAIALRQDRAIIFKEVVLKNIPARGTVQYNEIVYAENNGHCKEGQIIKITGGNNSRNIPRKYECVSRP